MVLGPFPLQALLLCSQFGQYTLELLLGLAWDFRTQVEIGSVAVHLVHNHSFDLGGRQRAGRTSLPPVLDRPRAGVVAVATFALAGEPYASSLCRRPRSTALPEAVLYNCSG